MAGYKKNAVIGIDIGTNDSICAYVGKAMVDIVQNEVSSRKTPTVVGFTDRERLLGDSAQVKMKSNFKNSIRNFRHLMGPATLSAEDQKKEKFWALCPKETTETADNSLGYEVSYKGEQRTFSATQVAGMYLNKMKETSETWCNARVNDVVVSCPSYFNDFQRQAMIDAASTAGLHCLRVMNEHCATALAYGIYRTKDFDAETPTITAFGHMGHSNFSCSIVSFTSSKLQVLAEVSDRHCAGRDMDEALIRHFSAEFEKKFGCNPLESKKALLKLEDGVGKCKKVLSANDEANIGVECLMEDEDFSSKVTREKFEELCAPLKARVEAAIDACVAKAGVEHSQIQFVEIVGGASRVPWFKEAMKAKFGGKDLATTLNADECVARGCALMAAILSPLYKVRDFKVEDQAPHAIEISWVGKEEGKEEDKDGDASMTETQKTEGGEECMKNMDVFNPDAKDKMDVKKYITWYRNGPFDLGVGYKVAEGAERKEELGRYSVDLPVSSERKKVKIEAKLNVHGMFAINQAVLVETEEYEETVREKREIPEEELQRRAEEKKAAKAAKAAEAGEEPKADEPMPDAEKKEEEKGEKKPEFEWVDVKKTKTRKKQTVLPLTFAGRHHEVPQAVKDSFLDQETKIQSETRDVKENDAKRNELESYVYDMRDKVTSGSGACSAYMKKEDQAAFGDLLMKGEDWLYDHFEATTVELCDKLQELQTVGAPVMKRFQDRADFKEYVPAFQKTIRDCRSHAQNPSADFEHIEYENKQKIVCGAEEVEKWLMQTQTAENKRELFEDPQVRVADLKVKEKELVKLTTQVMSEPKPKPAPVEEKKEEEAKPEAAEKSEAAAGDADGDAPMEAEKSPQEGNGQGEKEVPAAEATMEVD